MSQRKKDNNNNSIKGEETILSPKVESDVEEKKLTFDKPPHEFFGFRILRFITILCWAIIVTGLVWSSIPIEFFINPILKKYKIKKYYYPLEIFSRVWAVGILWVLNIKVEKEGFELYKDYEDGRPTVLMYSHSSYLDPIVLQGFSPVPCKYIYKKELIYLFPWLFLLAYFVGHIPINRGKKQSAISSIDEAAQIIKKNGYCVAIAPEGTRSKDGNLMDFKKGPFHLAINSQSTIIPVVFFGNSQIWNASTFFPYSGNLVVRCLPPIKIGEKEDVESVSRRVRNKMLTSLYSKPNDYKTFSQTGITRTILFLLSLTFVISWLFGYH